MSVKTVGSMALVGAAISGGVSLYSGMKARKVSIQNAQNAANANGGIIPVQGMTKDGKLWDRNMTVDDVKKHANKTVAMSSTMNALAGALATGAVALLTLMAEKHIFAK